MVIIIVIINDIPVNGIIENKDSRIHQKVEKWKSGNWVKFCEIGRK